MVSPSRDPYAVAGVDTVAGDAAVELMKASVRATHGPDVLGGVGGFAGLVDASAVQRMRRPVLATSTDGVGTKVAVAQAVDRHDTIGQDLVGMVVDDLVVVGARPIFMTDYIACGRVVPARVAEIVSGIAAACSATGTALVGGETAEHPGLLAAHEYDLAGAATGVVEGEEILGAHRVVPGDAVLALSSSGLHANGFSLVRSILAGRGVDYRDHAADLGRSWGEALLEPTRLYTPVLLELAATLGLDLHALSHVTGGGMAANLARVLPERTWVEVDRSTWEPPAVFRALAGIGRIDLGSTETTWNLGVGFFAVVAAHRAHDAVAQITSRGIRAWQVATVSGAALPGDGFQHGGKGASGGAVRLVGRYAGAAASGEN